MENPQGKDVLWWGVFFGELFSEILWDIFVFGLEGEMWFFSSFFFAPGEFGKKNNHT